MISHALHIAQLVFGILLVFAAFVVWSLVRRFSVILLCVTAFLLYLYLAVNQLVHYRVIGASVPLVGSMGNLNSIILILISGVFIVAFMVLVREERVSRGNRRD
jgi:hypothetical protein